MDVKYSSDVQVELVKHSASDQDVAFAARVSTQGERSLGYPETDEKKLSGLIGFLMRDRHGSPFEHSVFTFYVKAPIFVWREHMRHRIASYNEESGRYRVLNPEFYIPNNQRKLLQIGKPGAYVFEELNNGEGDPYVVILTNVEDDTRAYAFWATEAYLCDQKTGLTVEWLFKLK